MSFFKLRDCDVISTIYTAFPSYVFETTEAAGGIFESELIFIFNSGNAGVDRTLSDIDGNPVTGAYDLSGVVSWLTSAVVSGSEKRSLTQLRNIYASASFLKIENYTSSSLFDDALAPEDQTIHMLNIPQVIYGSEIKPGSFTMQTLGGGVGAEYVDDAFGGIFTGSLHVGCIFYQHGIVYFGSKLTLSQFSTQVTASFSGTHRVPTNLYLCRVPRGELNFSQNESYTSLVTGSNTQETSTAQPKTLITGVALYDSEYKLVGLAKLAQPILNEEDTGLLFRLKLSF